MPACRAESLGDFRHGRQDIICRLFWQLDVSAFNPARRSGRLGTNTSHKYKAGAMLISIGSDHRGVEVKSKLIGFLNQMGHETVDEGTRDESSVDYPDFASQVSKKVSCGDAERGILICGTGVGMSITANKYRGVRAAAVTDEVTAEVCRRHNDLNVLCLSADALGERQLERIVEVWLSTEFEGGRHSRRLDKIREIENGAS